MQLIVVLTVAAIAAVFLLVLLRSAGVHSGPGCAPSKADQA